MAELGETGATELAAIEDAEIRQSSGRLNWFRSATMASFAALWTSIFSRG
jgi:hypothetical protein